MATEDEIKAFVNELREEAQDCVSMDNPYGVRLNNAAVRIIEALMNPPNEHIAARLRSLQL